MMSTLGWHCGRHAHRIVALLLAWVGWGGAAFAQSPATPAAPRLQYRWPLNTVRTYEIAGKFRTGSEELTARGMLRLRVIELDVPVDLAGNDLRALRAGQSTATAFVIREDGYLLTCAHGVDSLGETTVVLGGREYPARIVARDVPRDLALLKIEATGLHPLRWGESAGLRLDTDVRIAGYPLSDLLGESIKITRGSVAGVLEQENTPRIQLDASLNPGNSGGPVVDTQGQVLGMVTAKIEPAETTRIGVAVPIDECRRWLSEQGLPLPAADAAPAAADLVESIQQAVALIRSAPTAATTAGNVVFEVNGYLENPHSNRFRGIVPTRDLENGKLLVDARGRILDSTVSAQIPLLLGPLAQLPIERLPGTDETSWTVESPVLISEVPKAEDSFLRFRRPRPWDALGFERPREPLPQFAVGLQTDSYTSAPPQAGRITVEKTSRMEANFRGNAQEPVKKYLLESQAELTFDPQAGCFDAGKLRGTLAVSEARQQTIAFELEWRRQDERNFRSGPDLAKPSSLPNSAEEVETLLQTLEAEAAPVGDRIGAFRRLARGSSELSAPLAARLRQALEQGMAASDPALAQEAFRAAVQFEPAAAVPGLIERIKSANRFTRAEWIDLLCATQEPAAVDFLIEQWLATPDPNPWRNPLVQMASVATPILAARAEAAQDPAQQTRLRELLESLPKRPAPTP